MLAVEDRQDNRLTITREAVGNSAANGRVIAQTDGSGGRYRVEYVSDTRIGRIVDPTGRAQTYVYDAQGRLTGVTDFLEHTTTYVWDARYDGSDPTDSAVVNAGCIVRERFQAVTLGHYTRSIRGLTLQIGSKSP